MDDLISRQAAIEVIDAVFPVDPMKSEYAQGIACGAALAKTYVEQLPSAQQWIPCSEMLPEEDVEVLITYRYKEGEGDTSHADMDITTYGQMYFGGNKVGNHKHWRQPFEYFESNYEVVAWMPLPSPYREETES